jgi:hypothetical protein
MMSGIRFRGATKVAAEGWDGDLVVGYEGPEGVTAIVWASRWDSKEDAREFATAYKRGLAYKWETLGVSPRTAQVEVRGSRVMVVEGFPDEFVWQAVSAAWAGVDFAPDPRDVPDIQRVFKEEIQERIGQVRAGQRAYREALRQAEERERLRKAAEREK